MKLNEIEQRYEVRFDLDGVLANFAKGMDTVLGEPYDDQRYERDAAYRKRMWKAVADYQKRGGEVWYELEMMPDARQLIRYVENRIDPKFEIQSATGDPKYNAATQKDRWVAEHIGPHVVVNLTRKAAEKAQNARPNRILIDDKEKAIEPWKAAGGIGILHTSANSTIQQLKAMGL